MVKFDNYVFLTICESSLDRFKFSQYSTYYGYCRTLNLSLKSGNLDKKEIDDIIKITNDLILIYGFDDKTCGKYIPTAVLIGVKHQSALKKYSYPFHPNQTNE